MTNKVGVIIQGPLLTFGQGPNNRIEGFDTFDTIIKNISVCKELEFEYVCCTWTPISENEKQILDKLKTANINLLVFKQPQAFDPDHRYKHHWGIKVGYEYLLKKQALTHIVKIRTDMFIYKSIYLWILDKLSQHSHKLLVSQLHSSPFYLGDFLYAAQTSLFNEFLTSLLTLEVKNLLPGISEDLGYKFMQFKKKKLNNFQTPFFLLWTYYLYFLFKQNKLQKEWIHFLKKNIFCLPEDLWGNILWRDNKICNVVDAKKFLFYTDLQSDLFELTSNDIVKTYKREIYRYYIKRIRSTMKSLLSFDVISKKSDDQLFTYEYEHYLKNKDKFNGT